MSTHPRNKRTGMSYLSYLNGFPGVDSQRETAMGFGIGSIFIGSQFPAHLALDSSFAIPHAPSPSHAVNPETQAGLHRRTNQCGYSRPGDFGSDRDSNC